MSESFLAAVEGGRKGVTAKILYKICTTMNVSADYFVRGKDSGFETDSLIELLRLLITFIKFTFLICFPRWEALLFTSNAYNISEPQGRFI